MLKVKNNNHSVLNNKIKKKELIFVIKKTKLVIQFSVVFLIHIEVLIWNVFKLIMKFGGELTIIDDKIFVI